MKGTDRAILFSLLVAAVLAGFYFMVLSPKREEASKLGDEVSTLEASILDQDQLAAYAEDARREFPRYYGRMVVLGKAVPAEADSASLLVQVDNISARSGTSFESLALGQGSGSTTTTAPAATPPAPSGTAPEGSGEAPAAGSTPASTGATTPASTGATAGQTAGAASVAPATETAAASLPIGATVGPAGLPTLPYDLFFKGTFFQVADFIAGVDGLIHTREASGQVVVDGRLLTVNGFSLQGGRPGSDPALDADFAVTSYVMPSDQGLTLGATPGAPGPPAAGQPQTTPASATGTP
ncbi:MAG TPA: hypothetical protein VHH72_07890 [Solirubrobacterales bacterium]|jgi:hypothetical protein|nr:hypothetical protein [Solirubrobacterales bacterium]